MGAARAGGVDFRTGLGPGNEPRDTVGLENPGIDLHAPRCRFLAQLVDQIAPRMQMGRVHRQPQGGLPVVGFMDTDINVGDGFSGGGIGFGSEIPAVLAADQVVGKGITVLTAPTSRRASRVGPTPFL